MNKKDDPCTCKYGGSPSSYHENCNTCHKYILTSWDRLEIACEEIKYLKKQVEDATQLERDRIQEILEFSEGCKIDIKVWKQLFPDWTDNCGCEGCCIPFPDESEDKDNY